jgi:hypothetical protein
VSGLTLELIEASSTGSRGNSSIFCGKISLWVCLKTHNILNSWKTEILRNSLGACMFICVSYVFTLPCVGQRPCDGLISCLRSPINCKIHSFKVNAELEQARGVNSQRWRRCGNYSRWWFLCFDFKFVSRLFPSWSEWGYGITKSACLSEPMGKVWTHWIKSKWKVKLTV